MKLILFNKKNDRIEYFYTIKTETEKALLLEGWEKIFRHTGESLYEVSEWIPKKAILFRGSKGIIVEDWIPEEKDLRSESIPPLPGGYKSENEMETARVQFWQFLCEGEEE